MFIRFVRCPEDPPPTAGTQIPQLWLLQQFERRVAPPVVRKLIPYLTCRVLLKPAAMIFAVDSLLS